MELFSACKEGNLELVKEIVKYTDTKIVANVLNMRSYSDNFEIVEFLVSKCIEENADFDWNQVLYNACHNGSINTVKFIIDKSIEKDIKLNYQDAFYDTCYGDSEYVIKGYNYQVKYGIGDKTTDRIEIIKLMISKGIENKVNFKWSGCFYLISECGYLEIVEMIFDKTIEDKDFNWNSALCSACKGGNIQIVNLIMDKTMNIIPKKGVLSSAFLGKNINIIDLMLACGATSEEPFSQEYIEYKQAQVLKFTKLHSDLISMILNTLI